MFLVCLFSKKFVKEQIIKGRQAYIVYPLIEESEKLHYKDLNNGYDELLLSFPRPTYQVEMLHGKMKPSDKEAKMKDFAEGKTHIEGSLSEIRVINSGFDYTDQPIVTISGGSGEGAEANVNLKLVQHRVPFLAGIALTSGTGGVDTVNDRIGFSTSHNFRENEEIQYESGTATVITGISTNSIYFARIVDASTITLHNNFSRFAIVGPTTQSSPK